MLEQTIRTETSRGWRGLPPDPGTYVRPAVAVVVAIVLLALPLYVEAFWLQVGFSVMSLAVGAIGLNLITGAMGQLSLANPFFMAIGALTYVVLASAPEEGSLIGLGWPPSLASLGAVVLAGLCGVVFAPLSARLKGIYLGMASLGLVFVSQHVLDSATPLSGGFNGRATPVFEIFGLRFDYDGPVVAGVQFGRAEMLWYLGLVVLAVAAYFAQRTLRSHVGRAMKLVAENEIAAAVAGVPVMAYKRKVFFTSSVYAGAAGVLYALSIGSIAPTSFGMDLSLEFLAMIVIGGMGSVFGAIVGAAFVASLPIIIQVIAGDVTIAGTTFSAAHLAAYLYGLAVILVLLFQPTGLAGLAKTVARRLARGRGGDPATPAASPTEER